MDTKICTKCSEEKEVDNFNVDKRRGGYIPRCKQCTSEDDKIYREKVKNRTDCNIPEFHICSTCNVEKPSSEFNRKKSSPIGIIGQCKSCVNLNHKKYDKPRTEFIPVEEKTCTVCRVIKSSDEFFNSKRAKHGLTPSCKACITKRLKSKSNKYSERNEEDIPYPEEKICSRCGSIKKGSEFNKCKSHVDGLMYWCKDCSHRKSVKYRDDNKDKIKEKENTPERRLKKALYRKSWRSDNRDVLNEKRKEKYDTDINYKLSIRLRCRIVDALRGKSKKSAKTIELLGCTIEFLRDYLEAKFLPTMTWDNYGPTWHVDHIRPCNAWDLTDPEQQKQCFHYTNLQPLFATTRVIDGVEYIGNINKGDKELDSLTRDIY
jgi:hypothetical protein